ncbi:MAG TPA: hypothetical protein VFA50_17940 [Stellaceae bacterium]|nr:hypothetical protein [Stellaceae bacterium]
MTDLLIRDLGAELIERLKLRAKNHGRSLQAEVKAILQNNVPLSMAEARAQVERIRAEFTGKKFSDSAELIREDRER